MAYSVELAESADRELGKLDAPQRKRILKLLHERVAKLDDPRSIGEALRGHSSPEMTMRYLDVVLTDLQREFELARSKPRHLAPQPKASFASLKTGLDGVIDSLLAAQHVLEMFRRALPNGSSRRRLDRFSNPSPKSSAKRASSRHPENG